MEKTGIFFLTISLINTLIIFCGEIGLIEGFCATLVGQMVLLIIMMCVSSFGGLGKVTLIILAFLASYQIPSMTITLIATAIASILIISSIPDKQ